MSDLKPCYECECERDHLRETIKRLCLDQVKQIESRDETIKKLGEVIEKNHQMWGEIGSMRLAEINEEVAPEMITENKEALSLIEKKP